MCVCVCVRVRAQSCPTLCDPMDRRPPGSSVHGILQAGTLEGVAIPFSRGSSWPRDWTCVYINLIYSAGAAEWNTQPAFFFFWFASNMLCFALFLTLGSSNFLNTVEFQASVEIKTHLIYYSWRKLFLLLSLNWTRSLLKLKFHQDDQKFGMKLKCDICSPELVSLWTDASVPHLFLQKHIQK